MSATIERYAVVGPDHKIVATFGCRQCADYDAEIRSLSSKTKYRVVSR